MRRVTGQQISARALVQPALTAAAPDKLAAVLWAMGHTVAYMTETTRTTAAGFAHNILRAKKKVLEYPDRWPPDLVTGLAAWIK